MNAPSDDARSDGTPSDDAIGRLTKRFVGLVDLIASRTTAPALVAVRAIAFAIVVVIALVILLTLALLGFVRVIDIVVDEWLGGRDWLTYFICAGFFSIIAAVLFTKGRAKDVE